MSAPAPFSPFRILLVSSLLAQGWIAGAATIAATQNPPAAKSSEKSQSQAVANYGQLPLSFEANQGQADSSVRFLSRGSGYSLFLTGDGAVLALGQSGRKAGECSASLRATGVGKSVEPASCPSSSSATQEVVRMTLAGVADQGQSVEVSGEDQLPGKVNYFLGNDPDRWRTDLPTYAKVRYNSVYPGVDLVYYGNQRQLEYDFVVAPGANAARIGLQFAAANRLQLRIAPDGDLVLQGAEGEAVFHKPVVYQEKNGVRQTIRAGFHLVAKNTIGFRLGAYDHARPLIIDPVLTYSTYLGGSGTNGTGDQGNGIAVDSSGNAYVVGTTYSTNFPVTGAAFQKTNNAALAGQGSTVFVTKLNPTGTALVYSTYLGGSGSVSGGDMGYGIVLDSANNAYITGATYSIDFPVTCGAFQTTNPSTTEGATTGFVARLNATGNALAYSTYLGGTGNDASPAHGDVAQAIAVDAAGDAYVTGYTYSSNFPVTDDAFQQEYAGNATSPNAFMTKLYPNGTAPQYSTFLGGSGGDYGNSIAIDASGDAFATGGTASSNFPVTGGALQSALAGSSNAFVVKLNPTGSDEIYSTYLGGNGGDSAQAIAIDKNGFVYVAGNTSSSNFPLTGGVLEGANNGINCYVGNPNCYGSSGNGAFVTKLSANGAELEYSTYLEGGYTTVTGLAVDGKGSAYVTGSAPTAGVGYFWGFQDTPDALPVPAGGTAAFLVKLDPSAAVLNYATLLGGSSNDGATALALDSTGNVYLTGVANSTDFPITTGAFQTTLGTPPGSLIPTSLSIVSQQFNCSVQDPYYVVLVDLMVNSDSNGPAPTGTVDFYGSFAVGEDGQIVAPSTDGTATVNLIGTSAAEVAQSATWEADYSGDSIYAGSALSGEVNGPGNCDSQSFVSRQGAKSELPQSQLSLPTQQGNNQSKSATRQPGSVNSQVTGRTLPKANNTASISGSNAFVSKFKLAAEANQTSYPILTVGITSTVIANVGPISLGCDPVAEGSDSWNMPVFLELFAAGPGPTPTGNIYFWDDYGYYSYSNPYTAPVAPNWDGIEADFIFSDGQDFDGPISPIQVYWTVSYYGDAYYMPSSYSGTVDSPGCPSSQSLTRQVPQDYAPHIQLGLRTAQEKTLSRQALVSTPAKSGVAGPKFTPPPAIPHGIGQRSLTISSTQPLATPSCIAPAVAAPPAFSLAAGTYTSIQTVTITDSTAGAAIYYTDNGTTPTNKSALYIGPFQIRGSSTWQAIAYAPGVLPSNVASATYTLDAAAPVFSPPSGAYPGPLTVTITSATPTAEIAYTPSSSNPSVYTVYTGPFTVTASGKFYALAQETGFTRSATTEAVYTIESAAAAPVFSLPTGSYLNAQLVTITDATPGAAIYYTTNGTAPTTSSTVYTGPITVPATETLQAIAVAAGYTNSAVASAAYTIQPSTTGELQFVAIPPCRIADTRNPAGAFGGPELAAAASRTFDIPQSACGIPATATAYSLNVTVVPDQSLGYLTLWPAGQPLPSVSTLNSDGRVKANAAITPAGANGGVSVYASDATQFILDIDGYFVPAGTSVAGLAFYTLTPCRIADTRNATGALGGPFLVANTSRDFPVQSGACGIPSTAKAYSLNVTAIPHGSLGYLTAWASGQPQPLASTLNASTGAVAANAAIVSAGSSGAVSIFASDTADVILDVNGYFAPPATGGLSLYTVTPCRALDTRNSSGAFDGLLAVVVQPSACAPPATAQAYVLNATVVPSGGLSYLTLWAGGAPQPDVSTLNADDGAITANMAIVSTTNGTIDAFSTDSTQLILDLSSYFAP
jgi:hypothetical protein